MNFKSIRVFLKPEWKKIVMPLLTLFVLLAWLFPNIIDEFSLYSSLYKILEMITQFLCAALAGFALLWPTTLVKAGIAIAIFFWYFYSSLFLVLWKKNPKLAILMIIVPIIVNLMCTIYAYFSYVSHV